MILCSAGCGELTLRDGLQAPCTLAVKVLVQPVTDRAVSSVTAVVLLYVVCPVGTFAMDEELAVGLDVLQYLLVLHIVGHVHIGLLAVDGSVVEYILKRSEILHGIVAVLELGNSPHELERVLVQLLPAREVMLTRCEPGHSVLAVKSREGRDDVVHAVGNGLNSRVNLLLHGLQLHHHGGFLLVRGGSGTAHLKSRGIEIIPIGISSRVADDTRARTPTVVIGTEGITVQQLLQCRLSRLVIRRRSQCPRHRHC